MVAEMWAAIPGFPNLEASTHGRIRSYAAAKPGQLPYRILKLPLTGRGYPSIKARQDNERGYKTRYAHVLIASAFHGPRPEGALVLHRNDIPSDVRPSNLYYGTYADNYRDSVRNGGRFMGPNPKGWGINSTIAPATVRSVRRLVAAGKARRDVAESVGLSYRLVCDIVADRTFRWVAASDAETQRNIAAATAARCAAKVKSLDVKAAA